MRFRRVFNQLWDLFGLPVVVLATLTVWYVATVR